MSTALSPARGADPDEDDTVPAGSRRRRLLLVVLAVVVLAAIATYVVAFSPAFATRTVTVRGATGTLAAQVMRVAAVDRSTPLLRLDTAAVAVRVRTIAEIAAAQVSTSFPSTVEITVSRRVAVGVVSEGSGYLLVDRTGIQYATVRTRPTGLPLFVVPSGESARASSAAVATVAAALPGRLRGRIVSIQALDPSAITLLLQNGRIVRWGSAARSGLKARILPTLLTQDGSQFDVTDPGRPFSR